MSNTVFQTYPSNIIHDIYVHNSVGDFFNITISEINNSKYEVDITHRNVKQQISSNCNLGYYPSAKDAFDAAIDIISKLGKISSIDNPCNTPFISKTDQDQILISKGINVTVTVNGK
ncbi:TPA: hypothetical protein SLG99_002633 [Serratia marcescens]|nr:hypothetical protein [Serratia marcescens]